MTTESPAISSSTDLVLQLVGGNRNGQLLPVSTAKCLLSSLITDKAEAEKYRCAIFRGEKGVAFRSYSELVLVNGNKTSVQWLKEGDTIQLTPEMKVVVKHLGTFAPTKVASVSNTPEAPTAAARKGASTLVMGSEANADSGSVTQQSSMPTPVAQQNPAPPAADPHVGQRVNVLSDQLASLVDAASQSGTVSEVTGATNGPASEAAAADPLSDQEMADASSSIQDYLNNALASTGNAPIDTSAQMAQTPEASPAGAATPATEPRRTAATLQMPAANDATAAPQSAAQLRKQEVASHLDRLLGGSEQAPSLDLDLPPVSQSTTSEAEEPTSVKVDSPVAAVAPAAVAQTTEAPADTPKAQSIEFLKSLGIDTEELGLSSKTSNQETITPELPQTATPQANVSSAILPTADEIIAAASAGAVVNPQLDSTATGEVESAPVAPAPAAPKKAESVADVLARMQNAGSLENFSMDGPEEASPEPSSLQSEVASPEPEVHETVVAETASESSPEGDEDNSVEDYMSQLLSRMRGGEDPDSKEDASAGVNQDAIKEAPAETQTVEAPKVELPEEKLTPEQFVPKERAVRVKSFDSLREIANNSNRLAIQDHLANQRRVSTQTKMQLALISLAFGVLFFLMSWVFSSEVSVGGVFCGIAFLFCGVVFAKFYTDEHKLDQSIIKAQKDKA